MEQGENLAAIGVLWYVVFLFSTVLHEASHALAARLGGDDTAANQVTLDPIPHIRREPFGMVLVPLISMLSWGGVMGWASAPYDPTWADRHPRRAALMALAGPAANLLLVLLATVAIKVGVARGMFAHPSRPTLSHLVATADGGFTTLTLIVSVALSLNLLLFVFNLLPLPPLDGASAVTLLMPESLARRWNDLLSNPQITMIAFLGVWLVISQADVTTQLLRISLGWLYPDVQYTYG